jgi:Xaa-Pro aminopeptidase
MARQGLDGFLVPHEDEHQNEYLPAANDRLAWASGFTGSAGAGVILKDRAAVFVDGRYTLQVRDQVDLDLFEIRDLVEGGVPAYLETASRGAVIGYDARLHSPQALDGLKAAAARAGAALKPVSVNPIDEAWGAARPAQPAAPVVPHPVQYAGEESASKRARVGSAVAALGADAAVITAPASIAWLFNIRGGDVIRSPLPLSQAVLRADGTARLFLDPAKVTEDLPAWLGNQVSLEAPEALDAALADLAGQKVLVDPAQSSAWYFDTLAAAGAGVVRAMDPCTLPRACKNAVEIAGTIEAHKRDGAALTRFLHWLATEGQVNPPDEKEAVAKLEAFREATGLLKDLSFDTIGAANGHGALPHYRPTERSNERAARLAAAGRQRRPVPGRHHRRHPHGRHRRADRRDGHPQHPGAEGPPGHRPPALPGRHHGLGHRRLRPRRPVEPRPGLRPRHRPRRRRLSGRPRRPAADQQGPQHHRPAAGHDRLQRARLLQGRRIRHPHREPRGGHAGRAVGTGDRPMHRFHALTLAPIDRRLVDKSLLSAEEIAQFDAYHARVVKEIGPWSSRRSGPGWKRSARRSRSPPHNFKILPPPGPLDSSATPPFGGGAS